jgi:hypothetical protein
MGLLRLLCALEQFKPHVSCACPPQSRRGQFPVTLQLFQPVLSALFDFEEGTSLFICCCPPRILPGGPDLLPKPGFFRIRPPVQSGIGRSLPAVDGSADTSDILVGEIAILSHVHQPLERLPVDLTARVQGLYLALDITRHVTLVEPAYVPIIVITMIVLSGLQPAPQSMPPTHTCLLVDDTQRETHLAPCSYTSKCRPSAAALAQIVAHLQILIARDLTACIALL